jgi:diguanylate cyclase (GGDEF)-like protein
MSSKITKFRKSITVRVVVPVVLVTLLQSIVVTVLLFCNVIGKTINNSEIGNFKSSVNIRKNYLENLISNSWGDFDDVYLKFSDMTEKYLNENSLDVSSILNDSDTAVDYLAKVSTILPSVIAEKHVNDAFISLDNPFTNESENECFTYLRAKNPYHVTNNEIDVLYAPKTVWRNFYSAGYGLDATIESNTLKDVVNREFITNPIDYYRKSNSEESIGYWSCMANIQSTKVLTYSRAFVVNDTVVGVIGIGITETYLKSSLASLNKGEEINIALVRKTNNGIDNALAAYVDYSLPDISTTTLKDTSFEDIQAFDNGKVEELYYENELKLYDDDTTIPEKWYVVGISPRSKVLATSCTTGNQIVLIYFIGFFIILILYVLTGFFITRPILKVSKSLNENNVHDIPPTKITEVDRLLGKVNEYSLKAERMHDRLLRIVEDSSSNISFFEYDKETDKVTATKQFFEMLHLKETSTEMNGEKIISLLHSIKSEVLSMTYPEIDENILDQSGEIVFLSEGSYLHLKIVSKEKQTFATLMDMTMEYNEKNRIAHERDYDYLTGLLNRRGFLNVITPLLRKDSFGALFMIDVDNLKYINDQFGHELGDVYLKKVGEYLNDLTNRHENLIACHISGDEFLLYLSGYEEKSSQEEEVVEDLRKIREQYIVTRAENIYISLSIGISHHEKDMDFQELLKRADYAMYIAKHGGKNDIRYFDKDVYSMYRQENVLYDDLNKMITNKLLDYAYQPIVDIHTGEILGYEALMRPTLPGLNPGNVLNAAKKFNRLYDIEKLTMFMASEKFIRSESKKLLFINSISSQVLTEADMKQFVLNTEGYHNQIVIELIEEDFGQNDIVAKKRKYLDEFHLKYAIDDYGTGYNNINMILSFVPEYVKIEGSLIRNIDKDEKKQRLTKSIISYCAINNIKVIAESVETIEELKVVKDLNVDYIQGYLLAKPNLEIQDLPEDKKEIIRNLWK